ncbi:AaceriACR272Cp [[Ashbya] aceris (nom. inval.)]|nr:AaceriACR272Cp [[Ashbya] aceris (nom. inval.)]
MKFISSFFLGAAALANVVLADSEEFSFLGVRSGSKFHFSSVHAEDGALKIGGQGQALSAVITDDGKLKLSDGKYAVVNDKGAVVEGAEDKASTGFSVGNGYLKYDGSSGFVPVANGDNYDLAVKSTDPSDVAIAIRAQSKTGSAIADFP